MNIQVGDLVTFKDNKDGASFIDIITRETIGQYYKKYLQKELEILKIERPKYEVVEEKKEKEEVLTKKEKEFLRDIIKYFKNNIEIIFDEKQVNFYEVDEFKRCFCCVDYPDNMKFVNVKEYREYTLEELGLEEN